MAKRAELLKHCREQDRKRREFSADYRRYRKSSLSHEQALAKALKARRDRKYGEPVEQPVSPASDDFLSTYEWRRVRMQALKAYGARCQCCGASPKTGATINVDHIKPRKLFPALALSLDNLQVLCHECNHGKGNWDMTDWRHNATEEVS